MESCVKDNSGVDVFALNAAMFAQYVIPAVYGVESMLLSAVSKAGVQPGSSIDSAWAAADETWKNFMLGFTAIQGVWGRRPGRDVWTKHRHYLLSRCFDAHHVCGVRLLHDFAVGYLLLYEIFIVMGLAFRSRVHCLPDVSNRHVHGSTGGCRAMICAGLLPWRL